MTTMTKSNGPSRSEVARGQLDHPVIDGDGHMETHESNLAPDVLVNMWTLFSWD